MKPLLKLLAAASVVGLGIATTPVSAQQPIRIGVPTAIQLQVGRDTQNAVKMAIDEINAKGGVLGRKLEMVVADETENPETGHRGDQEADRRRQGRRADRRLHQRRDAGAAAAHLARQDHLSRRRRGVAVHHRQGQGRTTTTTNTFSASARSTPRIRPARWSISSPASSRASWAISKIAIVGENAKWVQDLVPIAEEGRRRRPAPTCGWRSSSTRRPRTSRRCSPRSRTAARST